MTQQYTFSQRLQDSSVTSGLTSKRHLLQNAELLPARCAPGVAAVMPHNLAPQCCRDWRRSQLGRKGAWRLHGPPVFTYRSGAALAQTPSGEVLGSHADSNSPPRVGRQEAAAASSSDRSSIPRDPSSWAEASKLVEGARVQGKARPARRRPSARPSHPVTSRRWSWRTEAASSCASRPRSPASCR